MTDPTTCAYIPFDAKNPYQPSLVRALGRLGVRVEGRPWRWWILPQIRGMDVVHIHWTSGPANERLWKFALGYPLLALQFLWLRLQGRRLVWTVHNLGSHEHRNPVRDRLVSMLIGRMAHRVIVHGESAHGVVARRFGISGSKLVTVPHGNYIDCYPNMIGREEARANLGLDARQPVALFLGNIRPYKGVTELIEAFIRVAPQDAALVLAGRALNADVERQVRESIAGDRRITFQPGFVADDRVQEFMNAADVVVFPYREVLTSGAVVLAMSFAKACVAPRLGCIPDVLDERGAFLYDPDAPDGLANALKSALAGIGTLTDMGRHNLRRAEEWSWDRIAAQTLEAYRPARRVPSPVVERQANHV